ncbi:Homocitrate synthase, mitochondrial [Elsinoe australis]|uniref:homocitrate synthase n=1 Tax=Elsinoe australis TaxID=40998 RepID=A0A2P7Z2S6_9PEZI|nr:Homocitrate synthase, mitochondrial [Elsinoe australis]
MTYTNGRTTTTTSRSDDLANFKIIETTLREGEQFANAHFDTETKVAIARSLDQFGVDYIEVTSPLASEQSRKDCETIAGLGLRAKVLTHVRCNIKDAQVAIDTGVDGINVVMGTSSLLREHSHKRSIEDIIQTAIEVIALIKANGKEVRFSSEDSFRSELVDLLSVYRAVDDVGVDRVGIADTVGCASPRQVYELVRTLRAVVGCDIEAHFHNDTGCATANAFCALEAGATHIDTSVLGIGERNGITPLGSLLARMIVVNRQAMKTKYTLKTLKDIESFVAGAVGIGIPFSNPITGFSAFTHKAGIHTKAILEHPTTYEILSPSDFGINRSLCISSRLTGWNAIKARTQELGMAISDDQCRQLTRRIKNAADERILSSDEIDTIIQDFAENGL